MPFLIYFILFIVFLCCCIKIYFKLSTGWCTSSTCLVGKTALVTGATSGIGYETALDFAKRGARVILGSITEKEGEETKKKIINETENKNVVVQVVDLSSFESVRQFAKNINNSEVRLDILINNAGVTGIGKIYTNDSCLYTMQVNYFSAFLLTHLLIGLLKKSKGRIVNVSSVVAKHSSPLNVANLNEYKNANYNTLYVRSKLCVLLFSIQLAKKLQDSGVLVFSVHPGIVATNIFRNIIGLVRRLEIIIKIFFKTAEEGAQTTIHCAVSKNIEGFNGQHFVDCARVPRYSTATDLKLGEDLWRKSKIIVKLKKDEETI